MVTTGEKAVCKWDRQEKKCIHADYKAFEKIKRCATFYLMGYF